MADLDIKRFKGFRCHARSKVARREDASIVGTSTCGIFGKRDGFLGTLCTCSSHDGKIMETMLLYNLASSASQLEGIIECQGQ